MSTPPQLPDQVYACFLAEAPELLQTIEQDLLTLREDRSLNKVYNLMRATHTLKAMAASVDRLAINRLAHNLEDVFNTLYNPAVVIDSALEALLFRSYDCLRQLLTAEFTHTPLDQAAVFEQAAAVFEQLEQKLGDFSNQGMHLPSSAELGADITHSIFSTVVEEGLAALAAALKQPTVRPVDLVLQEQADVLLGLAEALNLKGFAAIAQTAIAALDTHPEQAITIAQIALADFQQGQSAVLAGDRTRGGQPSTTLQQLADIHYQSIAIHKTPAQPRVEPSQPVAANKSDIDRPSVSFPQTIRIDLERLERLKHLSGDLLTHQNRQDSAKEQLQDTLQNLREKFRQHQQTLNKIWAQSKVDQNFQGGIHPDASEKDLGGELHALLRSALEEITHLDETAGQAALVHQQWSQTLKNQQQLVATLQDDLTEARMASLETVFNRLQQVLHRLSTTYGKPTQLILSGAHVVLDKAIVEKLYDPLLHLVRNAFDHGIELAIARRQRGKPETGQIHILAYQQGKQIFIEVKDDGQGLDFQKIRERALQMNLLSAIETRSRSDSQLLDLLFKPGFSTASQVNELSGRGIGLDIVRSQLKALQGSITVRSVPQQGTTFILQFPLILMASQLDASPPPICAPTESHHLIAPDIPLEGVLPTPSLEDIWGGAPLLEATETALPAAAVPSTAAAPTNNAPFLPELSLRTAQLFIWVADARVYVLPYSHIEEHLAPKADQIIQSQNQRFLPWREHLIRVYPLSELLGGNNLSPNTTPNPTVMSDSQRSMLTLIIRQEQQVVALESILTRLMVEPELMVQSPDAVSAPPGYLYGYTRLENGEQVPVIDVIALLNQITGDQNKTVSSTATLPDLPNVTSAENSPPPTETLTAAANPGFILVVDDSPTIRMILTLNLEEAGYQVLQAQDGQEAIAQLQQHSTLKLVICDVEMPNLDGFEFLSCYHQDPTLAKVPVVMLSNWDNPEYRQMAMQLEAAAYFTKPYAKQEFLTALNTILKRHQSLVSDNR